MIAEKDAKVVADKLSAIAETSRIRIVESLLAGPKSVSAIATELKLELVNVSHYLGVMRDARVVADEKQGRFVYYSLNPDLFTANAGGATRLELGWCTVEFPVG